MEKEQKALIELIKHEMWGKIDIQALEGIDWQKLFEEAEYHKVWTFVYDSLNEILQEGKSGINVDADILEQLDAKTFTSIVSFKKALNEQKSILGELANSAIPFCILKGTTLAVNYPNPALRNSNDLDLYAMPVHHSEIEKMLKSNSYESTGTHTGYHTEFKKNKFKIELHNALAGLPMGETRTKLAFLKDIPSRAKKGNMEYGNFFEPDALDNALVQLLHMLHHTKEKGINIRMITDWMLFVNNNLTDTVWKNRFEKVMQDVGLDKMAKIVTRICKKYLGLDNPDITWCDDIGDDTVEPFWQYVLAHGTFETGLKKPKIPKTELRTDEWEYHGSDGKMYGIKLVGRNIAEIFTGRKSISVAIYNFRSRKKCRQFLMKLQLIENKYVKDYSFLA